MNIPSLSRRRREPPPDGPRDESVTPDPDTPRDVDGDGRIEAGTAQATYPGGDAGSDAPPVVTERDGDQATYRSNAVSIGGERNAEAERRAAVARAATSRSAGPATGSAGRTATTDEPRTPVAPFAAVADDDRPASGRTGTGDVDRTATSRPTVDPVDEDRTGPLGSSAGRVTDDRPSVDRVDGDRTDAKRADTAPVETVRTAPVAAGHVDTDVRDDDTVRTGDLDRPDPRTAPVPAGPRPRASLLATLGLILAVAGALFVLTGTLAGYGIGLGALGAVFSVLGLRATRRRHVAGTTDALIGVLVGLAAVVLGVVAFTGQFDWPTTDGDWVGRFREWLDSQFVDRF